MKIEPCPFCGVNLVRLHYNQAGGWPEWVECANCHAQSDKRALEQDAIDSWNRLSRIVRAAEAWARERKAYGEAPMTYNDLYEAEVDLYNAIKEEGGLGVIRLCADCYGCLSWDSGCARGVLSVPDRCTLCNPVPEPEGCEAETRPMFGEEE